MTGSGMLSQGDQVTVIKQSPSGQEKWRYSAQVLEIDGPRICLEAYFDRDDLNLHGLLLQRGDRFIETYYQDRWYNIFEVYAGRTSRLRGWYCNIACPAQLEESRLSYVDLALDLLVFPDGRQLVVDEDEFADLSIPTETRHQARQALADLQAGFRNGVFESRHSRSVD